MDNTDIPVLNKRTKLFLSYAHEDESWKDLVALHIAVLEQQGLLHLWVDTRIQIGADWLQQIQAALEESQVALLLISPNFLRSRFIRGSEIPVLMKAHMDRGMQLLPIIVRPCAWKIVDWLSKRQVRPKNGRAIALVDEAQADVDLTAITYEVAAILGQVSGELATDEIMLAQTEFRHSILQRQLATRLNTPEQISSGDPSFGIDAAFASLERIADNFKLAPSKSGPVVAQYVVEALRHGVPMFNNGSPVGCAIVYLHAAQLLRDTLLPYVPQLALDRVKNTLENLPEMNAITVHSAPRVAWQLRDVLDAIAGA